MDPKLQRRVQRYGWDKAEAYYEEYWSDQLRPAQEKLLEMAALQPGRRVLDLACGTGLVSIPAAVAVGPQGSVVATDISQKMVDRTAQEATRQGLANISCERMGAEELKLTDNLFDVALQSLGLMYVPEPVVSLREMLRVLKPGGSAVAAVWGARKNCGWADIFPIVDSRVESEVCPMFFQLGNQDNLQRSFTEAGFESVREERLSTTLHYDSQEDACGAAFEGGPVAMAYSRFDGKTREEARAEYLASIEPFKKGDGFDIPGEFVVVGGNKP
jgi:ubiquinone/menaquinone biosynthesis C-methylase UbiE